MTRYYRSAKPDPKKIKKTIDDLVEGINPKAKLPRGFGFWSEGMQIVWLRQNQKEKKSAS